MKINIQNGKKYEKEILYCFYMLLTAGNEGEQIVLWV